MKPRFLLGVYPAEHLQSLLVVSGQVIRALGGRATALYVAPEVPKRYFSLLNIPAGPGGETISNMFGVEWVAEKVFQRVSRVLDEYGVEVETKYIVGDPAREIVQEIESGGYDFAAVGTSGGTGLQRSILGSVSGKVAEYSSAPVLVVKKETQLRRLLACTDGSKLAACAVKLGAYLARSMNAELTVLSVARSEELAGIAEKNVEEGAEIAREQGASVRTLVKVGKVRDTILEASRSQDLLLLGSRGLSKLQRLLMGHVSLAVVAHADTNVFVVKSCPQL
ncbi:MAG: universal stress protein [Euryarchaeota archaeon]|nr:universal stress protein [Euryarchaeota archaeon]